MAGETKMSMRIFVATNNASKLARVRELLVGTDVECLAPRDLDIPAIEVEEGSDINLNAEMKARAYFGKTDLPILGMDTALVIPGEDLDPAKVKRNALEGRDETSLTQDEIAHAMSSFYAKIVERHGGRLSAYWEDVFALLLPDGSTRRERDTRPIIITPTIHGTLDPYFPLRSMYIVEPTGKYVADQTPEDHVVELRPYAEALKRLLEIG
jgi:inosine/xanthosine triphosphate pyrophosphatase family protein